MKKTILTNVLIAACMVFALAACDKENPDNEKDKVEVKEPDTKFASTTKSALVQEMGNPVVEQDTSFVAKVSWSDLLNITFGNPYGTVPLMGRKVDVLKYNGQTEDEYARYYVFLNDKLAGSLIAYNKNDVKFMNGVKAYLADNSERYVGIEMQSLFTGLGFDASDIDSEHKYIDAFLSGALYVAQQEGYDQEAGLPENWLRLATGYSVVSYCACPQYDGTNSLSLLTYVDVRAIYEFAHFSDIFGLFDFCFDVIF